MKRAYLYNKRQKEIDKANNDIGYELSRFEVSFQNRFFLFKEISVDSFLHELKDYKLFYFEDIKKKEQFINQYNKANSNKHRTQLIDTLKKSTPEVKTKMWRVGELLKMLDKIKFGSNGKLVIESDKYYLYGLSRFNRNKIFQEDRYMIDRNIKN
jgi:galactokinase